MEYEMQTSILGIDIAKNKFDAVLIINKKEKFKAFRNDEKGFEALDAWLAKHKAPRVHACMEATSIYGDALAHQLLNAGHKVSVMNPFQIKAFGNCELLRSKTDKADSRLIAHFCLKTNPREWVPKPPQVLEVQQMKQHLDKLKETQQRELNRRSTASSECVLSSIDRFLEMTKNEISIIEKALEEKIKKDPDMGEKWRLLKTIPGVGTTTIAAILSAIPDTKAFRSAKQVSALIGLNPKHHQSGSSVRGRAHISKTGKSSLRKSFFMPALVAMRYNPHIKAFAKNLLQRGKSKMVVVVAAMRKLVHIIYGVLKTGLPYDPLWSQNKYLPTAQIP